LLKFINFGVRISISLQTIPLAGNQLVLFKNRDSGSNTVAVLFYNSLNLLI